VKDCQVLKRGIWSTNLDSYVTTADMATVRNVSYVMLTVILIRDLYWWGILYRNGYMFCGDY